MQNETWVGLAWAGGLLLAMAAAFTYTALTFEVDSFDVAWHTEDKSSTRSGSLVVGNSQESKFAVPDVNVTSLSVDLSWTDGNGGDDTFRLTVTAPNGTVHAVGPGASRLTIPVSIWSLPQSQVKGVDKAHAAEEAFGPGPHGSAAWGEWKVKVDLVSAPPTSSGPTGCGTVPTQPCDGDQDFSLTFTYTTFRALLS